MGAESRDTEQAVRIFGPPSAEELRPWTLEDWIKALGIYKRQVDDYYANLFTGR